MFTQYFEYLRIDKKWAKLIKAVKVDDDEAEYHQIFVDKSSIIASDGRQVIRIERPLDVELGIGLYIMADRIFLPVAGNELTLERFPKFHLMMEKTKYTKTAMMTLTDYPLLAMSRLDSDFGVIFDIDNFRGTVEALASFEPTYFRAFGYEDKEESSSQGIQFECIIEEDGREPVTVDYMVMPMKINRQDLCKVDAQPLLFEIESK